MKKIIDLAKQTIDPPKPMDDVELSQEFVAKIDAYIKEANSEPYFKHRKALAPSDATSCVRRTVYLLKGTTVCPTFPPQVLRIFDNGNSLHDRYTKYFTEMGILVEAEREVFFDNPPVRGFVDAIVDFRGLKVIELKSINERGFDKVKAFYVAKKEHIYQIQLYFACTDIDSGFIFYENKNTQEMLPIFVKRDDALIKKILKKYAIILDTYEKGILPKRPHKETSSKCQECDVRERCWSDPDEGQKIQGLR